MNATCKIIACLREIASGRGAVDGLMKGVASNALAIVADMEEYGITEPGLQYFLLIAEEIFPIGNASLHAYLQDGVPDCEICVALMKHHDNPGHTGNIAHMPTMRP